MSQGNSNSSFSIVSHQTSCVSLFQWQARLLPKLPILYLSISLRPLPSLHVSVVDQQSSFVSYHTAVSASVQLTSLYNSSSRPIWLVWLLIADLLPLLTSPLKAWRKGLQLHQIFRQPVCLKPRFCVEFLLCEPGSGSQHYFSGVKQMQFPSLPPIIPPILYTYYLFFCCLFLSSSLLLSHQS